MDQDSRFGNAHFDCVIDKLLQPNASTALNVNLFNDSPNRNSRTLGKEVATSGPHHDNISVICLKSAYLAWPRLVLKL